jgi:hypothetical protein
MKSHESSKDIWREFCHVCGATIFWHCNERPELLDVSVGLLDLKRVPEWKAGWIGGLDDAVFQKTQFPRALLRHLNRD